MNDLQRDPAHKMMLTLHWVADDGAAAVGDRALLDVQIAGGDVLASVTIPRQQLLQAAAQRLAPYPLISITGLVLVVSGEITIANPTCQEIALDQLVANAVSADMLEDEPDAAALLAEFRIRLLKSLEYVDQAIASLTKD